MAPEEFLANPMEELRSDRVDRALMTQGEICRGSSKAESEEHMWLRRRVGRMLETGSNFLVCSRYGPQARAVEPSRSVLWYRSGLSKLFLPTSSRSLVGRLTGEFC